MGNVGKPNTADLLTIVELFEKVTHTLYNIDPDSASAYKTSAAMHSVMQSYDNMLLERVN